MKIVFEMFVKKEVAPAIGVKFFTETDCRPMIGDRINVIDFLNETQKYHLDMEFLIADVKSVTWRNQIISESINLFDSFKSVKSEPFLLVVLEQVNF